MPALAGLRHLFFAVFVLSIESTAEYRAILFGFFICCFKLSTRLTCVTTIIGYIGWVHYKTAFLIIGQADGEPIAMSDSRCIEEHHMIIRPLHC